MRKRDMVPGLRVSLVKDGGEMRGGQTVWVPSETPEMLGLIAARTKRRGITGKVLSSSVIDDNMTVVTVGIEKTTGRYKKGDRVRLV